VGSVDRRAPSLTDAADPRGRTIARIALGAFLAFAGISHLTWSRKEFQAQVPTWVPMDADAVVIGSGLVEIALGSALIAARRPHRALVVGATGAFFVAVFPGNISQYVTHTDAFGLDSDRARAIRLVFQPALVAWALWSTGAWRAWRRHRS
jgi:uncharacterized membrane protein